MTLRQSLFWDTKPETIDLDKNARYVIERVLDFGRDEEVRWLRKQYQPSLIKDVVMKSRLLKPRTRNLWTLLLKTA